MSINEQRICYLMKARNEGQLDKTFDKICMECSMMRRVKDDCTICKADMMYKTLKHEVYGVPYEELENNE